MLKASEIKTTRYIGIDLWLYPQRFLFSDVQYTISFSLTSFRVNKLVNSWVFDKILNLPDPIL